jgi:L-aminopeptidase/D-esterase-like protein
MTRTNRVPTGGTLGNVAGVLVGHAHRRSAGWQTGTTVVYVPDGAVAAVDVRGGGPGTRETDALDPRNVVDRVHAVCLTGGSAYGLSAADGVMAFLEARGLGVRVGEGANEVVPVVPTAVLFDLGRGGHFRNRPDASFGARAVAGARSRRVQRGSVGAGTGAVAGGLQGGVGMASVSVDLGGRTVTVAALAVVNSIGSVIDPDTGLPWLPPNELRQPSRSDRHALAAAVAPPPPSLNTTIGVVCTDADITRAEAGRVAMSAHDGLARAIRPAHLLMDGDTIFGLSTATVPFATTKPNEPPRADTSRAALLSTLLAAAADVFGAACTDAVLSASTISDRLAYRDLCPSAFTRYTRPT